MLEWSVIPLWPASPLLSASDMTGQFVRCCSIWCGGTLEAPRKLCFSANAQTLPYTNTIKIVGRQAEGAGLGICKFLSF